MGVLRTDPAPSAAHSHTFLEGPKMATAQDDDRDYVPVDAKVSTREELWQRLTQALLEYKDQERPRPVVVTRSTDGKHILTYLHKVPEPEAQPEREGPRRGRKPGGGLTPSEVLDTIKALKAKGETVNRPVLAKRLGCSLSHCKRMTRAAGLHGHL